eukprot:2538669-Amphidinium_carterae.1
MPHLCLNVNPRKAKHDVGKKHVGEPKARGMQSVAQDSRTSACFLYESKMFAACSHWQGMLAQWLYQLVLNIPEDVIKKG